MAPVDREALQPQLDQAQKALEKALDEACGVDMRRVNTGELIKMDETLAVASKAAKEAVSVRLRLRNQRTREKRQTPVSSPEVLPPEAHRVFDDLTGKRWHAFAVRPSSTSQERASLPDAFRGGWISFESDQEMRRLAPIPEKWQDAPIEDLRAMCDRAEVAPKRVSPFPPDPGKPLSS